MHRQTSSVPDPDVISMHRLGINHGHLKCNLARLHVRFTDIANTDPGFNGMAA